MDGGLAHMAGHYRIRSSHAGTLSISSHKQALFTKGAAACAKITCPTQLSEQPRRNRPTSLDPV